MLCGAVTIGIAWTGIYALITLTDAQAFSISLSDQDPNVGSTLIYYSFVTLTSLGYGDIHPTSEIARTASFLKAVTGIMFSAIFVAALVGNWKKS